MSGADWSKIQYVWNTLRVTAGKCLLPFAISGLRELSQRN
jgi:hypothetical protein